MKNLDLVLALAGGAVVGAALGILFAPKKGEDLREDIMGFLKKNCPLPGRDKKLSELADRIAGEIKD